MFDISNNTSVGMDCFSVPGATLGWHDINLIQMMEGFYIHHAVSSIGYISQPRCCGCHIDYKYNLGLFHISHVGTLLPVLKPVQILARRSCLNSAHRIDNSFRTQVNRWTEVGVLGASGSPKHSTDRKYNRSEC